MFLKTNEAYEAEIVCRLLRERFKSFFLITSTHAYFIVLNRFV